MVLTKGRSFPDASTADEERDLNLAYESLETGYWRHGDR